MGIKNKPIPEDVDARNERINNLKKHIHNNKGKKKEGKKDGKGK